MRLSVRLAALFSVVSLGLSPMQSQAAHPAAPFQEIAQTADLIFVGIMSEIRYDTTGPAPITEAVFTNVEIINATGDSRQRDESQIVLRYAGGPLPDGTFLQAGDTPKFKQGGRYILFARDDGKNYVSPLVGGSQGQFELISDPATSSPIILNAARRTVTGITEKGMPATAPPPVALRQRNSPAVPAIQPTAAVSADGHVATISRRDETTSPPLTLPAFKDLIHRSLQKPLQERSLNDDPNRVGKFYRMNNGQVEVTDNLSTVPVPIHRDLDSDTPTSLSPSSDATSVDTRGQELTVCGTQTLPIVMEQMPEDSWTFPILDSCMSNYNNYMGPVSGSSAKGFFLRRFTDGGISFRNGQNEIGGSISNADLLRVYGFEYGDAVGLCLFVRESNVQCSRIIEADIFWNPAYSYHSNPDVWFRATSPIYNLQTVMIHEFGHVWGYMTGPETEAYDYDWPSVMHGIYKEIYENGQGLHAIDAIRLRNAYRNQTTVKDVIDLGVEAYCADDGLWPSRISSDRAGWGTSLSVTDVTVENMSQEPLNNVRLRFYLAEKTDFTGWHRQVGPDWTWSTFNANAVNTSDYAGIIVPDGIPAGTYNLLAYIDRAGDLTDAVSGNNIGVFTDQVTIVPPRVSVAPEAILRSTSYDQNPSSQAFQVWNGAGIGTLNYSIQINYLNGSGWLSLNSYSGSSGVAQVGNLTASFNTSGLAPGTYEAQIIVNGQSGVASKIIPVRVTVDPPPAPLNDDLANAHPISGASGRSIGYSAWATKQTGEPALMQYASGKTVWWSWMAPVSGTATIDTINSDFDTILAVYTGGTTFGSLTQIAFNDDFGALGVRTSQVTFGATENTTYKIVVDGYNGQAGVVFVNWNLETGTSSVVDWSVY